MKLSEINIIGPVPYCGNAQSPSKGSQSLGRVSEMQLTLQLLVAHLSAVFSVHSEFSNIKR